MMAAIFLIVRRNLRRHLYSSSVTVLSLSLALGLVMGIIHIENQAFKAFTRGAADYDAVLGARGSQLQLVLNSIFHLETSPGNIPWKIYQDVKTDPRVERAIPLAVGDHFGGFRVVGTTAAFFLTTPPFKTAPGGRQFEPGFAEAVLGSTVARETGLKVGSTFHPAHGVATEGFGEHGNEYTVVGILQHSNSPVDRIICIPIEGIFRMDGHVLRGDGADYHPQPGQRIPDEHKELSSVLLKLKGPMAGFHLSEEIRRNHPGATLAYPVGKVMTDLFQKMGWANLILQIVAYMVVLVAAAAVSASLYNAMENRMAEFALLRTVGAGKGFLLLSVMTESCLMALGGCVGGFITYGGLSLAARHIISGQTGVVLEVFAFHPILVLGPAILVVLGALAGLVPGLKVYRHHPDDTLRLRT